MRHNVDKLNSRRWKLARLAALERDGWRCVSCGRAGRLQVDHIQMLSEGGEPYELGNLQALCIPCHFDKSWTERGVTLEQRRWRSYQRQIDLAAATR